jgi:hypothetical protein
MKIKMKNRSVKHPRPSTLFALRSFGVRLPSVRRDIKGGNSSQVLIMVKATYLTCHRVAHIGLGNSRHPDYLSKAFNIGQPKACPICSVRLVSLYILLSVSIKVAVSVSPSSGNGPIDGRLHGMSTTGIVKSSIGGAF